VNHIQVWKEPLPAKPISLKPYAAQESAENLKAHSHTINQGREAERMERQMSKSSAANRLTKPGASLPLFLLLLTADLGAVAFKPPAPGMRGGVHMPPAAMATAIQNHLGSLNPGVLGRLDAGALLAAVKSNILAAQSQPSPDSGIRIVSGLAIMRALAAPEEFSSLNAYLTSAKSAEQAALGRQAIADLTPWFSKIRQSPATQGKIMVETKGLQSQLAQAGFLDAAHSQALFDGTLPDGEKSASALTAPAVFAGGAAEEKPGSRPGSQLSRPERAATKRKQTPATQPAKPAPGLDFGEPRQSQQDKPVILSKEEQAKAEQYVANVMAIDLSDASMLKDAKNGARSFGGDLSQMMASGSSEFLAKSIRTIAQRGANGDDISQSLLALQKQVEELDPAKVDLGTFRRLIGKLPLVGSAIGNYVAKLQKAQGVIEGIENSLRHGKELLIADNKTLAADRTRMILLERQLEHAIAYGQRIAQEVQTRVDNPDGGLSADKVKFLQEEILFPLQQRIMDLQTQRAVNQQGALSAEILIKNNEMLADSVDRAISTIGPALRIGASTAIALDDEDRVNKSVQGTKDLAAKLITDNANRLRTQGVQIQKDASQPAIDIEKIKSAYTTLIAALDDLSRFRVEALGKMATTITELDALTQETEKTLVRMENSAAPREEIMAELDPGRQLSNPGKRR